MPGQINWATNRRLRSSWMVSFVRNGETRIAKADGAPMINTATHNRSYYSSHIGKLFVINSNQRVCLVSDEVAGKVQQFLFVSILYENSKQAICLDVVLGSRSVQRQGIQYYKRILKDRNSQISHEKQRWLWDILEFILILYDLIA